MSALATSFQIPACLRWLSGAARTCGHSRPEPHHVDLPTVRMFTHTFRFSCLAWPRHSTRSWVLIIIRVDAHGCPHPTTRKSPQQPLTPKSSTRSSTTTTTTAPPFHHPRPPTQPQQQQLAPPHTSLCHPLYHSGSVYPTTTTVGPSSRPSPDPPERITTTTTTTSTSPDRIAASGDIYPPSLPANLDARTHTHIRTLSLFGASFRPSPASL
jgi:hypothetical protein